MDNTRQIENLLREEGVEYALVRAGKHWVYQVKLANGITRMITFSKTPSDHRALMNNRTWLRRMKREAEEQTT